MWSYLIERKEGRLWVVVREVFSIAEAAEMMEFVLSCGVQLRLSAVTEGESFGDESNEADDTGIPGVGGAGPGREGSPGPDPDGSASGVQADPESRGADTGDGPLREARPGGRRRGL